MVLIAFFVEMLFRETKQYYLQKMEFIHSKRYNKHRLLFKIRIFLWQKRLSSGLLVSFEFFVDETFCEHIIGAEIEYVSLSFFVA